MYAWWRRAGPGPKRALLAASLGWMLDGFDVMLFVLVQKSVMADLHLAPTGAGTLSTITLLSAAAGGLVFGVVADRWGRVRALVLSVLIYSIFTAACGLSNSFAQLAVCRICLGLGMGGEWASGAALVSETWDNQDCGKALGFMQSSWAIGTALATVVNWLVQDVAGLSWRAVFFVGVLPAFFTLWARRRVEEPPLWRGKQAEPKLPAIRRALAGPMLGVTISLTLMNACTLCGWWGFNSWVPTYLSSPPEKSGLGLDGPTMTAFVVFMQAGMWLGYVSFGFISDALGRRRTYVAYLLFAAGLIECYTSARQQWLLFALGPVTAFFATGYYSGFGAVTAELYPTEIRATAQGFTYNLGRIASAFAPLMVGSLVLRRGYPAALSLTAAAFLAASVFWLFIPETRGRKIN
jgi:MFS family permease